jgi:hypothetical protein
MVKQVEIAGLDLRYESYRLKNPIKERSLLASISQHGIKEALHGIDLGEKRILLDGFKRYRCALQLSIETVPYDCLSEDEALGIIQFIRQSGAKGLNILEQAKLIDELISVHNMSYAEVAGHLEKSKAWVSLRAGLIGQMSELVKEKIFSGQFPVYSFMYKLRPFRRLNGSSQKEIDDFVGLVSGKGLSIRDTNLLCDGYFKGSAEFRQQIRTGDIGWGLKYLKETELSGDGCTVVERQLLKEMEISKSYMNRVMYRSRDAGIFSNHFYSQCEIISAGLLRQLERFKRVIEELHDRSKNP